MARNIASAFTALLSDALTVFGHEQTVAPKQPYEFGLRSVVQLFEIQRAGVKVIRGRPPNRRVRGLSCAIRSSRLCRCIPATDGCERSKIVDPVRRQIPFNSPINCRTCDRLISSPPNTSALVSSTVQIAPR